MKRLILWSLAAVLCAESGIRAQTSGLRGSLSNGTRVSVERDQSGPSFVLRLVNSANGLDRSIRLSPTVIRGKELFISRDEAYVIVVADTNNGDYVAIAGEDGRPVTAFMTATAAVSPDRALVIYQSHIARGEANPKTAYGVYRVGAPVISNTNVFYPVDTAGHERESPLVWVADRIAAFLDRSGEGLDVIAAEFSSAGQPIRVVRKPLDVAALANPRGDVVGNQRMISASGIDRLPGTGLALRLRFNSPHVRVRRFDITLW